MKAHLETILAILSGIKPGADRMSIYYDIGRAMGTARLGIAGIPLPEATAAPELEPFPVMDARIRAEMREEEIEEGIQ